MVFKRIFYAIAVIILAIIFIMYSQYPAYLAFLLILFIPMVFFIIMLVSRFFVTYSSKISNGTVVKGDKIHIDIEASNKFIFPTGDIKAFYNVSYGNMPAKKNTVTIAALPFSKASTYVEFPADYSGILKIELKKVKLFDYGKLFSISLPKNKAESTIMVLPQAFPLEIDYSSAVTNELDEAEAYHQNKKGNDKTEIFNIKEYTPGDQIKDIHWKLSTKLDKYMVKEYSLPLNKNLDILINESIKLDSISQCKILDKMVEVLFSIGTNLVIADVGFNVYATNTFFPSYLETYVSKENELYVMISQVLEMNIDKEYEGNVSDVLMFEESKKFNVIYITSVISTDIINYFNEHQAKNVTIIYINSNKNESDELLNQLPTTTKIIRVSADEKEMGGVYEIKL